MATRGLHHVGRYDALLLTSLLWFLAKFLRYAFPPLFDPLQAEYGASATVLGGAFTAFMLVYAGMQFPSGVLGDRVGYVRVVTTGALLAAAGAFVVVVAEPFWLVVVAMVVIGAGTGAHKTVAIGLLSRVYPARSGRALGVHDTLGTFGGVVAPAAVAVALGVGGADWRAIFLLAGGVGVLVAGAFALRVPRRLPDEPVATGDSIALRAYARPFRSVRFSAFVVVTLCFGFAYNGIVAFLPLFLGEVGGVSTTVASVLYGLLFAMSLVQLVTGELSDRVGRLPVIGVTFGTSVAAMAVLVAVPVAGPEIVGVPLLTAGVVAVLGLGAHGFRPVRAAHLDDLLPEELAGGGLGAVRSGLMGAGAIAPVVVGAIADGLGFQVAFVVLLAFLAAGLAVVLALWATVDPAE